MGQAFKKDRINFAAANDYKAKLVVAGSLNNLAGCNLVTEAIVEQLDVKKTLFSELEAIVCEQTVLTSNTSSLSITAIAAALKRAGRLRARSVRTDGPDGAGRVASSDGIDLHQYYEEDRYRPSVITAQRLAGGLLGRKSDEGFFRYESGVPQVQLEASVPEVSEIPPVWISPRAARRSELLQLLKNLGASIETGQSPSMQALTLVAPLGYDITTVAVVERLDPARTVGIDMLIDDATSKRRVLATNPATHTGMRDAAHVLLAHDGKAVSMIRDSGGFVTQRVVATIVNIASDICQQGICCPKDLETAVTLGLGYPTGLLAMGDRYGPTNVLEVLFNMQTVYGDQRYRPSPWLRRRGAIGLSLMHEES